MPGFARPKRRHHAQRDPELTRDPVLRQAAAAVGLALVVGIVLVAGWLRPASAQSDTAPTSRIAAGSLLGFYSGGLASNVGSTVWCTETGWGAGCIRTFTLLGAAAGATAGGFLADADRDALERTAIRSAVGFGIGAGFGVAAMYAKSAVGWRDALMIGAVGGAIGAKPFGAALGFSGGLLVGFGASYVIPDFGLPEIAATALAGMAAGVLADWVLSAEQAGDDLSGATISMPLIRVPL
jgi:hypothetical protein